MRGASLLLVGCVAAELVGCGLTLDLDPVAAVADSIDAGHGELDGASGADAGGPRDAGVPADARGLDAGSSELDAGPSEADAASPCTDTPCRLLAPQCGCPPGQACYPVAGAPVCLAEGTARDGEACGRGTSCAGGLSCIVGSGDTLGTCRPYCRSAADCGTAERCVEVAGRPAGTGHCERICDPFTGAGCAAGLACYVAYSRTLPDGLRLLVTGCNVPGSGGAGSACTRPNDCAPSHTCDGGGRCRALCMPGFVCPSAVSCMLVDLAGSVPIGICP